MRSSNIGSIRNSKASTTRAARAHLREAATDTRNGVRDMGSAAKELAQTEFDRLGEQASTLRDEVLVTSRRNR